MCHKSKYFSLIYNDEYKIFAANFYLLCLPFSSYITMLLLEFYYFF